MVLKPYFLRGFKTLFFHRKTEGPARKPDKKIGFSVYPVQGLALFASSKGWRDAPGNLERQFLIVLSIRNWLPEETNSSAPPTKLAFLDSAETP